MSLLIIQILIIIGLFLSVYAFYVGIHKKNHYKPACDINDKISCSKAFESKYGKTFGISNSIHGIIFFALIFVLSIYEKIDYIFYFSLISVLFSVYLIYLLQFKLKIFCFVCYGTHLVNFLILVFSYLVL